VHSGGETFIEHMKTRVDYINGYWKWPKPGPAMTNEERALQVQANGGNTNLPNVELVDPNTDPFISTSGSIAFYDAVVVVEKYPHPHPTSEVRGSDAIPYCTDGQANGCHT